MKYFVLPILIVKQHQWSIMWLEPGEELRLRYYIAIPFLFHRRFAMVRKMSLQRIVVGDVNRKIINFLFDEF